MAIKPGSQPGVSLQNESSDVGEFSKASRGGLLPILGGVALSDRLRGWSGVSGWVFFSRRSGFGGPGWVACGPAGGGGSSAGRGPCPALARSGGERRTRASQDRVEAGPGGRNPSVRGLTGRSLGGGILARWFADDLWRGRQDHPALGHQVGPGNPPVRGAYRLGEGSGLLARRQAHPLGQQRQDGEALGRGDGQGAAAGSKGIPRAFRTSRSLPTARPPRRVAGTTPRGSGTWQRAADSSAGAWRFRRRRLLLARRPTACHRKLGSPGSALGREDRQGNPPVRGPYGQGRRRGLRSRWQGDLYRQARSRRYGSGT